MNKQMLIGLGVVVAGYLAYKHFKKPETMSNASGVMNRRITSAGAPCMCADGSYGNCAGNCDETCCKKLGGEIEEKKRPY